ncbi:MAG: Crp/Fnr family transcriptional regulator [Chloroflexi bacterium]|nr:Crp/Fnr family transcriptional regulator [Chloroflexota bacterium]
MSSHPHIDQFVQQLRSDPFFSRLDAPTLENLAQGAIWREYAAGETIFWEGEVSPGLYYLQSGWVKAVKSSPSGREQALRFLEAGELFNEVAAFSNQPNPATAVALEPAGVWLLKRDALLQLLRERPDFAQHIIASMAERILHLATLVADLSLRSVNGRLARLILESADDDILHRPRWYTQSELAARLGTVPDVIQRALRSLESDGFIEVQKQYIRILDGHALTRIAT